LINNDDVLKISDFGISHIMNDKGDELNNNAGTKYFLAPETWIGGIFKGKPADIWAIGGTLFYFLYGKPPFNAKTAEDLKNKILNDE
jgi:[calcium/calmodulin-dependent protein kinase] kinase